MCELIAIAREAPFRVAELWPLVGRLERYGIAGFGWGAAWLRPDGSLATYRDIRAFANDPEGRELVGEVETERLLVHLRRPSRLSTLTLADTQPFVDPAGRFAFAHNGDLQRHARWRAIYRASGRIQGRADSEVAERWLEDRWEGGAADRLLPDLHATFGGQANLAMLEPDGGLSVYAGNRENPVFRFRLGDFEVVSTGIYSLDRSLFRFVAADAVERVLIRQPGVCVLGGQGVRTS